MGGTSLAWKGVDGQAASAANLDVASNRAATGPGLLGRGIAGAGCADVKELQIAGVSLHGESASQPSPVEAKVERVR